MAKLLHRASTKYHVSQPSEFEPGSRGRVLKNSLGITSVRAMEDEELKAYMNAERTFLERFTSNHTFRNGDLHTIHRVFLGRIYPWAGTYRTVNISKGGFPFPAASVLPEAMEEFERDALRQNTPCQGNSTKEIAEQIARVHADFLYLHPYRDGNGRTARLLATLMAYQAGAPGLDFGFIGSRGKEFDGYVRAIQLAAVRDNYKPMQTIIERALVRAERLRVRGR